jgi:hypothetical protein
MIKEQKIITSNSASVLNERINQLILQGYQPLGSHKVVETHHQLRYSGMQHHSTTIDLEYSQTMIKK